MYQYDYNEYMNNLLGYHSRMNIEPMYSNPIETYENEKNTEHSKIKSQYIDLNEESTKSIKNEEMMKQIKSTLDDNLKVIFNFSYENFLSKESESESKKSSLHDINE